MFTSSCQLLPSRNMRGTVLKSSNLLGQRDAGQGSGMNLAEEEEVGHDVLVNRIQRVH